MKPLGVALLVVTGAAVSAGVTMAFLYPKLGVVQRRQRIDFLEEKRLAVGLTSCEMDELDFLRLQTGADVLPGVVVDGVAL